MFNKTKFSGGMTALYNGEWLDVHSADFRESLFGLFDEGFDSVIWVRCENVAGIKVNKQNQGVSDE